MSTKSKVIRLNETQSDMTQMQLDVAGFQSELPIQHKNIYFEDTTLGLEVGIWDTTSMQEAFGPYPGDEFMWLLEGQVSMIDVNGDAVDIKQGQTFCIRNGIPICWKQVGFLKKFYMTYADPNAQVPDIQSATGDIKILDPDMLMAGLKNMDSTEPFVIENNLPVQRDNILFTNDTGNMYVGMWDSTPFESEMRPFPCHEFVQLLEGEVTITESGGDFHQFNAGDAFFIPKGTECQWHASTYIKKYYSILDPGA